MSVKPLKKQIQEEAYRIVFWQLVGVMGCAFFALLIRGEKSSVSVLAGGLAYGIPNLFFVWRVFRYAGAQQMVQFMTAFCLGEMIKLILSAVLFLVIVKTLPVSLLSVLVGFIAALISFWVACLWLYGLQREERRQ